jgi:hypothetical protein
VIRASPACRRLHEAIGVPPPLSFNFKQQISVDASGREERRRRGERVNFQQRFKFAKKEKEFFPSSTSVLTAQRMLVRKEEEKRSGGKIIRGSGGEGCTKEAGERKRKKKTFSLPTFFSPGKFFPSTLVFSLLFHESPDGDVRNAVTAAAAGKKRRIERENG